MGDYGGSCGKVGFEATGTCTEGKENFQNLKVFLPQGAIFPSPRSQYIPASKYSLHRLASLILAAISKYNNVIVSLLLNLME